MPINQDKLALRAAVAQSRPTPKRGAGWRYKTLDTTWRKPKGVDNHQRKR